MLMKIVVIDTDYEKAPHAARAFLPKLLDALTAQEGDEVIYVMKELNAPPEEKAEGEWRLEARPANPRLHKYPIEAEDLRGLTVADAARRLNEFGADVYLIWTSEEKGWSALPLIDPKTATIAVAHADSEEFYAPVRHYRSFLTRVVGTTPETCVGLVLSCVIDKERVEWIAYDEAETAAGENLHKTIENHRHCFEKALADALAAPRSPRADFTPLKTAAAPSPSWFDKLKAKFVR